MEDVFDERGNVILLDPITALAFARFIRLNVGDFSGAFVTTSTGVMLADWVSTDPAITLDDLVAMVDAWLGGLDVDGGDGVLGLTQDIDREHAAHVVILRTGNPHRGECEMALFDRELTDLDEHFAGRLVAHLVVTTDGVTTHFMGQASDLPTA